MTLGISMTSRWQIGYVFVSMAQGMLAGIFLVTKGMWEGIALAGFAVAPIFPGLVSDTGSPVELRH
jgi:hypothetical protein